jgi:hypothetical protein
MSSLLDPYVLIVSTPAAMGLGPHTRYPRRNGPTVFQFIESTASWKNLIGRPGLLGV